MVISKQNSFLMVVVFSISLLLLVISTPGTDKIYKSHKLLYPSALKKISKITNITLENGNKSVEFRKNKLGSWEITNNLNYPAQVNLINELLLGIAYLQVIEEKTKDRNLYHILDVDDLKNKNSNSTLVTLMDDADNILVKLIVGKREKLFSLLTADHVYVRKFGEASSWLVQGKLPISVEFKDWVRQPLLAIRPDDIGKLTIINQHSKDPMVFYLDNLAHKENNAAQASAAKMKENNDLLHLLSNIEYQNVQDYSTVEHKWQPGLQIELDPKHSQPIKIEVAKIKQKIFARVLKSAMTAVNKQINVCPKLINNMHAANESWVFEINADIYNFANKPRSTLLQKLNT